MPPKPKSNWNDVQTAIATAAIVTTLGMWNLFATPAKAQESEADPAEEEAPILPAPPLTKPPVGFPLDVEKMPYVKIMFTQVAPQTTTNVQQPQQKKKKKRKNNDNGGGGGGEVAAPAAAPVTQTQSS